MQFIQSSQATRQSAIKDTQASFEMVRGQLGNRDAVGNIQEAAIAYEV